LPGVSLGGITRHNLRDLNVEIPRGGLVALTGVSGSGKSTLAFEVLAPSVEAAIEARSSAAPGAGVFCRRCLVDPALTRVAYADSPAGRGSLASTPATMTGLFDHLRDRFAAAPDARAAGLARRHFSTNARGGRCEACEGLGQVRISLDFMPDLWVPCDECRGARFTPAVLACRWQGLSIAECLSMRVRDARRAFQGDRPLEVPLAALDDLGLGYLTLGQPTSTLSGGERQRLALAIELMKPAAGACLYLFDEPTTGLHPEDVRHLLGVFDRLVGAGHTLLVVEHNLDVIKSADWVIDLGPEGGPGGGTVVATGTPEDVAMSQRSHTGHALRRVLSSPGR